jgi:transcriptional regulator with XRE-family HTH domain
MTARSIAERDRRVTTRGEARVRVTATDEPGALGELLRRHRLAAGLTQEALAEQAGLSARGIADLERGTRRFPYAHTMQRLVGTLELTAPQRQALLEAGRRRPARSGTRSPDWPDPNLVALERASEGPFGSVGRSAAGAGPNPLPTPLAPLIGRAAEMAALRHRMGPAVRLLTLTGPGGTGKTRLALAFAAENLGEFADGVCFVPLAATLDPGLVPSAIAHQLGVREGVLEGDLIEARSLLAEAYHLPIAPHDCTGPVNVFACLHLCASAPNTQFMESVRAFYRGYYADIVEPNIEVRDGHISFPTTPGLGTRLRPEVRERSDASVQVSVLEAG